MFYIKQTQLTKIKSNVMKNLEKIKSTMVVVMLLVLTTLSSCSSSSNDSSSSNSTGNTTTAVTTIVSSGTWKITYYYDTDHDATSNFTGYNFTFGGSSALTATNGTNNYSGYWTVSDSNSDDDSLSDLHFNIAFSSPTQFEELTSDWEIIEKSATVIKLKDVSGGNGGTDYLTFTKN